MKLKLLALLAAFYSLTTSVLASENLPHPTDTVTNLVDRSAALLMIDEGRKFFEEGRNRDALQSFREASIKDPNSWKGPYWVAMCHYRLNNFGYALKYANESIEKSEQEVDKEVYELLGRSYHRMGNLDSALINYKIALSRMSSSRAKELGVEHKIKECEFAQLALSQNPASIRKTMTGDINSGYNDYSPVISADGKYIYFVSRRANTTGGGQNPYDQEYYEDIYRGVYNAESGQYDSISNNLGRLNTTGFDALSYLSADGTYALTTLNTTAVDEKPETRVSDICEVQISKKGDWSAPKIIKNKSINSSFFDGAPTMTADGNTMYFVSDRKGEKWRSDIYVVHKNGKKWGEAQVLPETINTAGNETTPYITPDGQYLFFSSDGHLGMGGYDIYVSQNLGSTWSTPMNLGASYNTVNNDTHFQYYPATKSGVLATFEIIGNKASLDIYQLDMSAFQFPK